MKNVFFVVMLFGAVVLNVKYSLDLTELFSYCWALVETRWD